MVKVEEPSFFEKVKDAKKLMVMDLGFLGDAIHLIPALWCIRQAMPNVQLDVVVSEHIKNVMEVVPWVDNVIGYPRFPKGPPWYKDIGRVMGWRREGYDAVINLNGSDRSSLLTLGTGAKYRLGRIPPKIRAFWKYCVTDAVYVPRGTMVVYKQAWKCIKDAGFPGDEPIFNTEVPEEYFLSVDPKLDRETDFIHISPFTTQDYKELPPHILAEFINRVQAGHPELKFVLSCAPDDREKRKMRDLLKRLDIQPWRVFSGDLTLMELAAVIARSKLHLGGDSGALHVAFMVNTPTFSWFREYSNRAEWTPEGDEHEILIGEATPDGIQGITIDNLVEAFAAKL